MIKQRLQRPGRALVMAIAALAAAATWRETAVAEQAAPTQPGEVNVSKDEAEGMIFERQQIMTQLDKDAETLGQIVAGEVPADRLAETAKSIAQGAKDSAEAFKTKIPGGRTKPEAWSNWPDFSKRMDDFVRASDGMANAAKSGNTAAVTSMLGDALPCKQCHDTYRIPKT